MVRLTEPHLTIGLTSEGELSITSHKKTYMIRGANTEETNEWHEALEAARGHVVATQQSRGPPPLPTGARTSSVAAPSASNFDDPEISRLMTLIQQGSMFIKYKHKKGKDRMIYCPNSLDRIIWGDQAKKKVKGYLMVSDLIRISDGCFGSKRNENAFTIVAKERTLELEASGQKEKSDWIAAIQHLIDSR